MSGFRSVVVHATTPIEASFYPKYEINNKRRLL